jgi:maleylacetate reductase
MSGGAGLAGAGAAPFVKWSLADLPGALEEAGIVAPFLIASPRWSGLDLPCVGAWHEVPSEHVPVPADADGILAVGGGSAIDTGKHASAESGLPVVHVPTTYSGAEWTTFFGVRSPDRVQRGGGAGAHPVAIVYDVELTLDLPLGPTVGTALNALAHCAEALYVAGRTPEGDAAALEGARLIGRSLPRVAGQLSDRDARDELLHGAAEAGRALGIAGLGLAHAMAQALGGRYGIAHGAMNALCLPPALEFNRAVVPDAVAAFGDALGADPVEGARQLARLGGFERLRDFGVPQDELADVAEAAAARPGNRANPRPATAAEIDVLFRTIW